MAYRRITTLLADYTVIDFETSGLSPASCEIIELAAVRVRGDRVSERFQTLVRPRVPVSSFISDLTGITNEMLESAPPLDVVLPAFLDFLGDDVLMGHNVRFDLGFLEAAAPDFEARYLDTMLLSRNLAKGHKRHRLQDLCLRYGVTNDSAHRAMGDCIATYSCYLRLKALS